MGKIKLLGLVFVIIFSFGFSSAQINKYNINPSISNEDSLVIVKEFLKTIDSLNEKINKIQTEIPNDSQLINSLEIAEKTLTKQNYFIDSFGTIYTVITVFIGLATLLIYFISIRPLIKDARSTEKRANTSIDRLNNRFDYFDNFVDEKLDKRFRVYEERINSEKINELFKYLKSPYSNLRRNALESLLSTDLSKIDREHIKVVFEIVNNIDEEEKSLVIESLIQWNSLETKEFLKNWANVGASNLKLKIALFEYYVKNDFREFLYPASILLISAASPHIQFENIADNWSLLGSQFIPMLLNYERFVTSLSEYSKEYICDYLDRKKANMAIEKEVNESLIMKKRKKRTDDT